MLERRRRVREAVKQAQYTAGTATEQVAVLLGDTEGLFGSLGRSDISAAKRSVEKEIENELPEV